MSDEQPKRPVSEISHLFLSNVRDLAGNGMPRPQRKPPAGQAVVPPAEPATVTPHAGPHGGTGSDIDLTPEEFAHVFGTADDGELYATDDAPGTGVGGVTPAADAAAASVAPVTALLGAHLGQRQLERAREYARHLAASAGRVGLIDLDAAEFRLFCFDPAVEPGAETEPRLPAATGPCDAREIAEAVEELNVDVDRWLVLLPAVRGPEAKDILRDCDRWVLLTTCDHDGVVSAYRTLKGVADVRAENLRADGRGPDARLSVAVLDAAGDAEAARVQQKLAGVCRQFIDWDVESEPPVRYAAGVAEHPLMNCRVAPHAGRAAGAAGGPHWDVVAQLVARARRGAADAGVAVLPQADVLVAATRQAAAAPASTAGVVREQLSDVEPVRPVMRRVEVAEEPVVPTPDVAVSPAPAAWVMPPQRELTPGAHAPVSIPISEHPTAQPKRMSDPHPAAAVPFMSIAPAARPATASDDVIDLPGEASDAAGILAAVLRRPEFGLVECPVGVPGCPAGRLAVTRGGGLALVAAATRGLAELRAIGKAFQWMLENRGLVAMAVPQFAIDAARPPAIVLLVDQADISADLLAPMMQADHVTVRAYRTLRWGGRTGLLLDAA